MKYTILWILVIGILIAVSVLSIFTHNCSWIICAGALIIILGIVVESWEIITKRNADDLLFWKSQEAHTSKRHAILLIILGTLVAGFGALACKCFLVER